MDGDRASTAMQCGDQGQMVQDRTSDLLAELDLEMLPSWTAMEVQMLQDSCSCAQNQP